MCKKRIAFVMSYWGYGGGQVVAKSLIESLSREGYDVTLIAGGIDEEQRIQLPQSIRVFSVDNYVERGKRNVAELVQALWHGVHEIRTILDKLRPEVVILTDFWTLVNCVLALWFRTKSRKIILWLHLSLSGYYSKTKEWALYKPFTRFVDQFVVVSDPMKGEILEYLGPSAYKRTTVIENFVFPNSAELVYKPGSKRFVFIGRLMNEAKRLDRLLKAFSTLDDPSVSLDIIGDGPDKDSLVKMAEELGIGSRVHFTGWISNPYQFISTTGGAEALILSSDYESFGLVLLEALIHGLPCIAMDCPVGPRSIIRPGFNGFLVPFSTDERENVSNLGKAIETMAHGSVPFSPVAISDDAMVRFEPQGSVKKWEELIEDE